SLNELTRHTPGDAMSWYEKSKAEETQGRLDDALRSAVRAAALGPRSPDALNQLGVCQAKTSRIREALQSFEQALAIDPSNGPIWVNRGNAHRLLGEKVAARDALERAATLVTAQTGTPFVDEWTGASSPTFKFLPNGGSTITSGTSDAAATDGKIVQLTLPAFANTSPNGGPNLQSNALFSFGTYEARMK